MKRLTAKTVFALLVFVWLCGIAIGNMLGHDRSEAAWVAFTEESRAEAAQMRDSLKVSTEKLDSLSPWCRACTVMGVYEWEGSDWVTAMIRCDHEAGIEVTP